MTDPKSCPCFFVLPYFLGFVVFLFCGGGFFPEGVLLVGFALPLDFVVVPFALAVLVLLFVFVAAILYC
ncbi:MAG: hypothetical protein GY738_21300 [Pseudoalteromonas sp.]|nr:hypothetical protein [Pseudoalteromonas sp.]